MKKVAYSKQALRALDRAPADAARLLRLKIRQYAEAPETLANIVKVLKGHDGYLRLRVGDWRVIFTEDGEVIAIIRIARRDSAYE